MACETLEAVEVGCPVTCHGCDSRFLGGITFHGCVMVGMFATVIKAFCYVLVCSDSARGGYESIDHQEHLIQGMWVHEKGQSGQT